jgi:hypothetical protein
MNNLGSTAPISAINRNAYLIASWSSRRTSIESLSFTSQRKNISVQLCKSVANPPPKKLNIKQKKFQEVLVQLDKRERLEKLEETFQTVCDDYARILGLLRQ